MMFGDTASRTRSSPGSLRRRAHRISKLLPILPIRLYRQIDGHVLRLLEPRPQRHGDLLRDIFHLLDLPGVRIYLLHDWDRHGPDRWGAIVAAYLSEVSHCCPRLYGSYIQQLTPLIARIVAPVADLFRMSPGNEFRLAVGQRTRTPLQLSYLGPLGLFFLESTARVELAWDRLVGRDYHPSRAAPFSWVPGQDSLKAMLRLALLGHASRELKPKALLYSPLARYLEEMGLIHRTRIDHKDKQANQLWLLSDEIVVRGIEDFSNDTLNYAGSAASWEMMEATCDLRTGHSTLSPETPLEQKEATQQLLEVALSMLLRYRRRSQHKRLILWAYLAKLSPGILIAHHGATDESTLRALASVALSRRVRQVRLVRLNRCMDELIAAGMPCQSHFTATQCRTYLTRIRQEFRNDLLARMTV